MSGVSNGGSWLEDADVTLYHGDVLATLRELPAESVDCVVTSPPYWGLRDYGTGAWEGGDAECDHLDAGLHEDSNKGLVGMRGPNDAPAHQYTDGTRGGRQYRGNCAKCGATRIDQQLGLEPTPEQYVERMVEVFREVRRVLAAHGTVWLNLGDSYAGSWSGNSMRPEGGEQREGGPGFQPLDKRIPARSGNVPSGLKPKDLVGIPWRVAFALQQPYYAGRIKDERDRIWLAATVEAEGCMFIHKRKVGQSNGQGYVRKNDSYGAGLEVASTDRVVVERCMAITGLGSISEQSPEQNTRRKQTIYRWNLRSKACRDVIRELYPHFIAKQHEARLLLGCPSSGDDASKAWASLKALHQGQSADIDFAPPESLFEGGWYLRSDIIWSKKPNPMPESVTDRPTKAHEYVFLLSKQPRYFFDQEAVREPATYAGEQLGVVRGQKRRAYANNGTPSGNESPERAYAADALINAGRNIRSVWEIATQPYPEAHFATFPEELARRCIAAGTSEKGKCPECGTPWIRITEQVSASADAERAWQGVPEDQANRSHRQEPKKLGSVGTPSVRELGWKQNCPPNTKCGESFRPSQPIPCIVLDPFMGSGTVAFVARKLGRHAIGIDLSESYLKLAARRLQQQSLFAESA